MFCLDQKNIYLIVEALFEEKIHERILKKFEIEVPNRGLEGWLENTEKIKKKKDKLLKIAMVGKYAHASDAYLSIHESFKLASYELNVDLQLENLCSESLEDVNELGKYDAVCVPYGFGIRGTEGKLRTIEYCRKNNIPFLGICYGMQLACIEYARNVLGMDANSIEIDSNTANPLFIELRDRNMRLGKKEISLLKDTFAYKLFGKEEIVGRHRHRYFLNPEYIEIFKGTDLVISGLDKDKKEIAEIVELKNHPFFIAVQFHPEFETKFSNISPLFIEFLRAGING